MAVATSNQSIQVTWDLPVYPNGPILYYALYYRESDQIMVHSMQRQPLLKEYGFTHITSSPRYPQSKRALRTVKSLLDKNRDPYAALLAYRSTPLENSYSPAEHLMGRKLRTTVPVALTQLVPHLPNFSKLKEKEKQLRERQRKNFNHHHHAVNLKPLQTGDNVRNSGNWNQSTVICGADTYQLQKTMWSQL